MFQEYEDSLNTDQILHEVPVAEVLAPVALWTVVRHLHTQLQVAGRDPVHLGGAMIS